MRPREYGNFISGIEPKVILDYGERLKVAGPCEWFDEGARVSFWVVTDLTGPQVRKIAHSLELA
ncbi:hypothetical protein EN858_21765 [Mesorhizobium sp. M4B.F.Ca.ET.215.01.1.1]|uniref:hypothetical protein n=1 Tax=unclassified Mesorhizobium TaxID=325217 RepID=UPI000FCC3BD4|nr:MULTISPECIES: hypothetical protein [unclassified Mesorhizobium]RVD40394.1 hypothetical protein EN741_16815 [Mesorhizobium sp. M4B.F.Ca.ET.019.03.1.1]TGQ08364.1 hypothetical protein EN858_21765 [Mesorhizobium sp. M4B.F.Ca.ET.215.01.1.1]TGQ41059.1 hypothetical protein EN863_021840 [Mesorhizobium sp. M00.F.Ca.ET.220.01.1.1]TGR01921.1 hypothetical protein EN846_18625 [Mesorhizobium sp. M4B.F.Ca.ET.203.01.1.1]TGT45394.1 hypothetical protein EN812_09655 [Mesorhizobium sp. M4B.F.Ca.ET.169.01.1.1]